MLRYRAFAAVSVVVLTACADSTAPDANLALDGAPAVGPTLTVSGLSGIGSSGVNATLGALGGSPFAIPLAGNGQQLPAPSCAPPVLSVITCSATVNGLTFNYSVGARDSIGIRFESRMTGTLPAAGSQPARRISRVSTSWSRPVLIDSVFALATWNRSTENGTSELLGAPNTVMTDSAWTELRMYLPNLRQPITVTGIPRMVGSSRRVVWTRTPGQAATFWRETTTYDSTTVIRSVIETPAGTRRCQFDLGSPGSPPTCTN